MTIGTRTSSALRGAAFGAAYGASFWAVFLAFARYAAPAEQSEPVSCVQAVRSEAASPGLRSESAAGAHAASTAEAQLEPPVAHGRVARALAPSKAGVLGHRVPTASGAGLAAGPLRIPRRDPPRVTAAADSTPSAEPVLGGLLQQLPALLAQVSQGRSGDGAAGHAALSPELLQKLLGGSLGASGEGVSPELLQKLLGARGTASPPDLELSR